MLAPGMLGGGDDMPVGMTPGSMGAGGTGTAPGSGTPPEPSGLPVPGAGGVARPAGAPGNLRVRNWAGFSAAMSYTFDDSNQSQLDHYAELQALGVRMTFYLQTNKVAESSSPIWAQAVLDGHELGNHTRNHQPTGPDIANDTDAATQFIESRFGVKVYTMAAPNGSQDYSAVARTRFLINRGVFDQLIRPNDATDPFNLYCFVPLENAQASAFNAKVDAARAAQSWQVVLVHGFNGASDRAFQPVDLEDFVDGVTYAKGFGDVWIDSVVNVASYWRAQKLFTALTPVVNAAGSTWSWALPEHFPPRKYLRVTVDGGTLSQAGKPLVWDEHGYYEVALDLGSITLSP
jgi:peptidoglycan/xylan/chitin deacetylase (PgdA/CDA1 family)